MYYSGPMPCIDFGGDQICKATYNNIISSLTSEAIKANKFTDIALEYKITKISNTFLWNVNVCWLHVSSFDCLHIYPMAHSFY